MQGILKKLALALGVFKFQDTRDLPVCVVGAGPAGLAAAAELELKGKHTVVFEKQYAVGGKCQAIYQEYVSRSGPMMFIDISQSQWQL
jgi:phytoene dehydrogenase-like protein